MKYTSLVFVFVFCVFSFLPHVFGVYNLRVNLYSYIPDTYADNFSAMKQRIINDNPNLNLTIDYNTSYKAQTNIDWLSSDPSSSSGYAIVEIDTIFYDAVTTTIKTGLWNLADFNVSDWKYNFTSEWTVGSSQLTAVPHWYCCLFAYTRTSEGSNFPDYPTFHSFLSNQRKIPAVDISDDYSVPGMYLQSYSQEYPESSSLGSVNVSQPIIDIQKSLINDCQIGSQNPCTNGTFNTDTNRYYYFLTNNAAAYVGYSETLSSMLIYAEQNLYSLDIKNLSVQLLPLNVKGPNPSLATFYTDAFLLNSQCTGECFTAATQLIQYLTSASTYYWMLKSQDTNTSNIYSRYLIPPVKSLDPLLLNDNDPIFTQLINLQYPIQQPYPFDFSITQDTLYQNILNALNTQPTITTTTGPLNITNTSTTTSATSGSSTSASTTGSLNRTNTSTTATGNPGSTTSSAHSFACNLVLLTACFFVAIFLLF